MYSICLEGGALPTMWKIPILFFLNPSRREAFIKKKSVKFFTDRGGGSDPKNFMVLKVMFKIHFWPFWVFDISRGKKTFFFKKYPNNGLVHGREGGGCQIKAWKISQIFFFFNEGFPRRGPRKWNKSCKLIN